MTVYSPSKTLDYVLIYALIFPSGTILFNGWTAYSDLILIALTAMAGFCFLRYVGRVDASFILYLIALTLFLFVIRAYTDNGISPMRILSCDVRLVFAYMVLKLLGRRFLDSYLNVIVFFSVVSWFGFASDISGLSTALQPVLPKYVPDAYEGFLYGLNHIAHRTRNHSIFYEPGAFQFFVNAGLFILLFAKTELTSETRGRYLWILVITLLTTVSTTGLIIFGVMLVGAMVRKSSLSRRAKAVFVVAISLLPLIFATQVDYALSKFDTYTGVRGLTDQRDLRSFDLLVDTTIIRRHFFGLGEEKYHEAFSNIGKISPRYSSSNGVTKLTASYGIPFAVFYFGTYFVFFLRFVPGIVMPCLGFTAFMVFLAAESYYVFAPICLVFVAAIFVFRPSEGSGSSLRFEKQRQGDFTETRSSVPTIR